MAEKTAYLVTRDVRQGDAAGEHLAQLVETLAGAGFRCEVVSQQRVSTPPEAIGSLAKIRAAPTEDVSLDARLTILQYAAWFPLAERVRAAKGAVVFWYHGVTPPALWGTATERDYLERSVLGTELAWHAHLAVACSPFTAHELHQHNGYPLERIRVVPIGVDLEAFARPPAEAELAALRRRWGLEGRRILLYTGRVAGNKRLDLAVEALSRLVGDHPEAHLLIVGDTTSSQAYREHAQRLQAQAERAGLGGRVTLTGRVPEIAPYYHLAEVLVLPSQHEGFGVPLVEAMAAGVPVVASASGAIPWVLGEGDEAGGTTFAAGDAGELARHLARLLDDAEYRRQMIARGRARAQRFGREAFRRNTLEVVAEAERLAMEGPAPAATRHQHALHRYADVALRDYAVRSHVPVVGRLIEWVRRNSTMHVKEAYLDRIVEQQVVYNRMLADELARLQSEVARLYDELAALRRGAAGDQAAASSRPGERREPGGEGE